MSIAIIDCGAGNLHSVRKALARVAANRGMDVCITTDAEAIFQASHIVLPGVGTFADCMAGLMRHDGLKEALLAATTQKTTPLLGICVGMQMLFEAGHEYGVTKGLGLFKGQVKKLIPTQIPTHSPEQTPEQLPHAAQTASDAMQKHRMQMHTVQLHTLQRVPHMGWNALDIHSPSHPFFAQIAQGAHAYFVHSYHAVGALQHEVLASVDYGGQIVACIGRDNIVATQFHPEKSQTLGLQLIDNFLRM